MWLLGVTQVTADSEGHKSFFSVPVKAILGIIQGPEQGFLRCYSKDVHNFYLEKHPGNYVYIKSFHSFVSDLK